MMFYRCTLCAQVLNKWDINDGACPKCGGKRVKPSELILSQKIIKIVKHPKLWALDD